MINDFEKETSPLTDEEKKVAQYIATRVRQNIGVNMIITSNKILDALETNYGMIISGARLRKIINYIRRTGMVVNLIATSKGYYVETDPQKVIAYVDSLVQRAEAIMEVARSYNTGTVSRWQLGKEGAMNLNEPTNGI